MTITEIDLSKQVGVAQIVFALGVIVFVLAWKFGDNPKTSKKK